MALSKNEIKFVKSLQIKKYRDLNHLFVVEGVKLVNELLAQTHFEVDRVFYTPASEVLLPKNIQSVEISKSELERISGLKTPNQVLAVVKYPTENRIDFDKEELVLVLENINDPGNLGTILRTADWFGIKTVFASKTTVDLFNPKVIQASMGAIYRIDFHKTNLLESIEKLKENNFNVIGAALNGESIYNNTFELKTALIMGSESHGISTELQKEIDQLVLIPQYGKTESLNVAMATGIILSHYRFSINA